MKLVLDIDFHVKQWKAGRWVVFLLHSCSLYIMVESVCARLYKNTWEKHVIGQGKTFKSRLVLLTNIKASRSRLVLIQE